MNITPIKTRKFLPPKDRLEDLIEAITPHLEENSIIAITSKVISICEGRCVKEGETTKDELVEKEADMYLPRDFTPQGKRIHSIKNGIIISAAGIDESNGNGYFILWPSDPKQSAQTIYQQLKNRTKIQNLGVIITDSNAVPFRRGIVGISIAHYGFVPLRDYRGEPDIFGREMIYSQTNIPDSLAAAAVLAMGEAAEQTPLAIIKNLKDYVHFAETYDTSKIYSTFEVPFEEDMFHPFFASAPWKKGKS